MLIVSDDVITLDCYSKVYLCINPLNINKHYNYPDFHIIKSRERKAKPHTLKKKKKYLSRK